MAGRTTTLTFLGDTRQLAAAMDSAGLQADAMGKTMGDSMDATSSRVGGVFQKLGNTMSNWGIPFGESVAGIGDKFDETSTKGQKFGSAMSTLGGATLLGVGAAAAAVAAEGIHLATTFDATTTSIAANGDITTAAAQKIGSAFLNTAGTTIYSGQEIATAYAGVVGQLTSTEGHALSTSQAMTVMQASMDLAEGSGSSLGDATTALASVMQAYGQSTKSAASDSDILFNAAKDTGTSVSGFAAQVSKLKSTLGVMAPSLAQTSGLIVDLANHGETGRKSISAVNTALTTLIKTSTASSQAQQTANAAYNQLPPSLQAVADGYKNGSLNQTQMTAATKNLDAEQKTLLSTFTTAQAKVVSSGATYKDLGISVTNAKGNFVGIGSVIAQVKSHMDTMSSSTDKLAYLQTIFGTSSTKLMSTIEAGPAAFDKYTASVSRAGAAHAAAEKQSKTFQHTMETLKATAEDYGVKIGNALIPKLEALGKIVASVVQWFTKHKAAAEVLAGVIGGVLLVAIGAFVVSMAAANAEIIIAALAMAPLVIACAAVAVGAIYLATHWKQVWTDIKNWFDDAVKFLRSGFGSLTLLILGPVAPLVFLALHWQQIWTDMKSIVSTVWDQIKGVVMPAVEVIRAIITGQLDVIKAVFQAAWDIISGIVRTAWDIISTIVRTSIDIVVGIVKVAIDLLTGNWGAAWNAIKDIGVQIWNGIQSAAMTVFNGIKDFITSVLNGIESVFSSIWNAIRDVVMAVWNAMVSYITTGINLVWSVITTVMNTIAAIWSTVWNTAKSLVQSVWSTIQSIITTVLDTIWGVITTILSSITSVWNAAWNGLKGVFADVLSIILSAFTTFAGGILGVASKAFGWIPGIGSALSSAQVAFQNFAANAQAAIDSLRPPPPIDIQINTITTGALSGVAAMGAALAGRAGGGPVSAAVPYWIGENGPEIFVPSSAGNIIPTGGLQQAVQPLFQGGSSSGASPSASGGSTPLILQLDGTTIGQVLLPFILPAAYQKRRQVGTLQLS